METIDKLSRRSDDEIKSVIMGIDLIGGRCRGDYRLIADTLEWVLCKRKDIVHGLGDFPPVT